MLNKDDFPTSFENDNSNNFTSDNFNHQHNGSFSVSPLIALDISPPDAEYLCREIPNLKYLAGKIGYLKFLEELLVILHSKIKTNFLWRFIRLIIITFIAVLNSNSIQYLFNNADGWSLEPQYLIPASLIVIYLVDWLISQIVSEHLTYVFYINRKEWLETVKFNNLNHPLQKVFDKTLDSSFQHFIGCYKKKPLSKICWIILLIILLGEGLISLDILLTTKDEFPIYLMPVIPFIGTALNISTGVIKAYSIAYPEKLLLLKEKLQVSKKSIYF